MDERSFYTESNTTKPAELNCPHCQTTATYELRWVLCRKKDRLPGHADERDRARFAKAQSYMVLTDDKVACSNLRCRKRFDVSGIKTMAFLSAEQEAELPKASEQRPGRGDRRQRQRQGGGQPGQGQGQGQGRRGQKSRDRQGQGQGPGKGRGQKGNQQQPGNKRGQQKKKKRQPEVYFPSDYVNYRP